MFSPRIVLSRRRAKRRSSWREQARMPSASWVCFVSLVKRRRRGLVCRLSTGTNPGRLPAGNRRVKPAAARTTLLCDRLPAAEISVALVT